MSTLKINKIEEELLRLQDYNSEEEFFGIAVELNGLGRANHSGLILCYENKIFFFHYDGEVKLEDITSSNRDIYFKKIELFPEYYFPYIRAHFDLLLEKINPEYGFVFTDSFYDNEGNYVSDIKNLPDFCTCVGFCINIIRSLFLKNVKYIEINDWDSKSLKDIDSWFIERVNKFIAKIPEFDTEKIDLIKNSTYKRIIPIEILISGFFANKKNLPIRKNNIDPNIVETMEILKQKWLSIPD